jgi:hypothetical protein
MFYKIKCLQNPLRKGFAGKIFFLNELAPVYGRGLFVFDLYIQYSGLSVTKMPLGC